MERRCSDRTAVAHAIPSHGAASRGVASHTNPPLPITKAGWQQQRCQRSSWAAKWTMQHHRSCPLFSGKHATSPVSYTHLRAHETLMNL
eukprot:6626069-Prymnesium_polylepis.1